MKARPQTACAQETTLELLDLVPLSSSAASHERRTNDHTKSNNRTIERVRSIVATTQDHTSANSPCRSSVISQQGMSLGIARCSGNV